MDGHNEADIKKLLRWSWCLQYVHESSKNYGEEAYTKLY